jgi:signal transduction histidine kinase
MVDTQLDDRPRPLGPEPALGVALAALGLGVVVFLAGMEGLGSSVRLGLVPAAAVIGALLVLRHRDRRENSRRETVLRSAIDEIQAKSQLLSGVAHEIQDPLTSLLGLSELLRDTTALSTEEIREFIDLMHGEANDLAMLAEDLYVVSASAYTGAAEHVPSPIDLLLEADRAVRPLRDHGRQVRVRGRELVVVTELPRLRHVLRSVLANVDRFGGKTIEVVVEERDGTPTIIVSDDGPPLDDEAIAQTGAGGGAGRSGRSGVRIAIASMMAASTTSEAPAGPIS